jgi:hypothetical protein
MDSFTFTAGNLSARARSVDRLKDGSVRAAVDFSVADSVVYTHSMIWTDAANRGVLAQVLAERTGQPTHVVAEDLARFERQLAGIEIGSAAPGNAGSAEPILQVHTARQVGEATSPEVDWEICPYAARGAVTQASGKVKAAGKTTLLTYASRKKLDGLDFLGHPTRRGPVLYLTEQPARSFRETLRRAALLEQDDFHVIFWHETRELEWPALVRMAVAEALQLGATLLIVDTLPQFAGLRGEEENSAGAALEAVRPLQEAAALHNLAVIFVTHDRKRGGQVSDSGRGSSAFAGAVDIVLSIRRPDGDSSPNARVIHALSRFDETPETLRVELRNDEYVVLGEDALDAARTRILEALPGNPDDALTLDELLKSLAGIARTTAQSALKELIPEGSVQTRGRGVKGDPVRYWRPDGGASP